MTTEPTSETSNLYSLTGLARLFELDRKTAQRKLLAADLQPESERNGAPVYRLKHAAVYLVPPQKTLADGTIDPTKLSPKDLRDWEAAILTRRRRETVEGSLVPASEVEAEISHYVKLVTDYLVTLPDRLERDADLTPTQWEMADASINDLRQALFDRLTQKTISKGPPLL